jgi:type II secretory pathway pseudopilin PulG
MRHLRRLYEGSAGQGVIEILAVFGVFGALVGVGVPAFLGYQDGRSDRVAQDRLLAAVPAVEVYRSRHGSYRGLDTVKLFRIDPRIPPTLSVLSAKPGRFCLVDTVNGRTWSLAGPVRKQAKLLPQAGCGRS